MSDGQQPLPVVRPDQLPRAEPLFERIAIFGLGFIGGSIALAARQVWPSALVIGVDNNDVLEAAMRLHAVDVGADDPVVAAEADLVVLAAPVLENVRLVAEIAEHLRGSAVVTDVGGSKRAVVDAAAGLPARLAFVGGHPLAGAPRRGIDAARPDLFVGRPWLLTPPAPDAPGLDRLITFVQRLGSDPRVMSPAEHDHLVSYLAQLPQVVVSTLMQVIGEQIGERGLNLAGRGLLDTTRLAAAPAAVWKDVLAANADLAGRALDAYIEMLTFVRERLESGETIEGLFESAAYWRGRMPARRASEPS
jgi:prephenate dehydrogenase